MENIALDQPAWAAYPSTSSPASHIVHGNTTTRGDSGVGALPFLAVDLDNNVPVGTVSLLFVSSKWLSSTFDKCLRICLQLILVKDVPCKQENVLQKTVHL